MILGGKTMKKFIDIDYSESKLDSYPHPIRKNIIDGEPIWESASIYRDEIKGIEIGIWGANEGKWLFIAEKSEQCHVLIGKSNITNQKTGEIFTVEAGDSFFLEVGFEGIWEVIEPTRKEFLTFD